MVSTLSHWVQQGICIVSTNRLRRLREPFAYDGLLHGFNLKFGWAGRSRKEAMELSLPHSVWSKGSSLDLIWSRPIASGVWPRWDDVGVSAAAAVLVLVTGMLAMQRLRRRRQACASRR